MTSVSYQWTLFCLFLLALASSACNDRLDPSSRVTEVRVLGVRADLPYAHPGDTVHLDALGVDPDARGLTWGWTTCVNPKDTSVTSCIDAIREQAKGGSDVELVTGTALDTFDVTIANDVITSLPAPFRDRAEVGVVAVLCPGTLEPHVLEETSAGDPIPFVCRDEAGARLGPFDFVTGVKRLFVRSNDRNANPEIASIVFDGEPWNEDEVKTVTACDKETNRVDECPDSLHHEVTAKAADGSAESGTDETGTTFDEQVVVQYYAEEGTFEDDVRVANDPTTKWVATRNARGRDLRFWFVLRDNRGGVSWVERRLHVDP